MEKKVWRNKVLQSSETYKLISSVANLRKRNLVRGYSVKAQLTPQEIDAIRRGNSYSDNMLIGAILKGPGGLLNRSDSKKPKKTSNDLSLMTSIPALDWRSELCYTVGYINSLSKSAIEALRIIKDLVRLEDMDSNRALDLLLSLSREQGASNFLSYKLAYLTTARDLTPTELGVVSQIEDAIFHRDNSDFHFSAVENLSSRISLFVIAQRRISELAGAVGGEFRKSLCLNNFVPTPLDEEDVAGFLLRATESCLIDTVYAILVIFNLANELESVVKELERRLDPGILTSLLDVIQFAAKADDSRIVAEYYRSQGEESEPSLGSYRTASAFLERPKFAVYRSKLDRVIGVRLLGEIVGRKVYSVSKPFNDKRLLLAPQDEKLDEVFPLTLGPFYRTFLFLRFIGHRPNLLNLSDNEIKFVFENTVSLETLLTEEEMNALYQTASPQTRSLVAVLALALFRKKSIDPDIDFRFRNDFISHVKNFHGGSIVGFINYLLSDSPAVANYIVTSLDEVTLEKMYSLVANESQAAAIRGDILRAVGLKLNRLEYIIEADAITTHSKVSKLMQYFDGSRMYVDSIAMKKWLDSNPSVATEQYRALYSRGKARMAASETEGGSDVGALVIETSPQSEYLISQIARDAFEQFCLNSEFGIESYLGRRIRHNTLDGVTTETVDAVLRKPGYRIAMSNPSLRNAVDSWMNTYTSIINKLRRERLQFKSSNSLFKSALDLRDSTTKENLRKLSGTVRSAAGSELLNDVMISFCWVQITPQLENAARFIKTTLLREANASLDKHFSGHSSAIEAQIKSDLHEAVNEVFRKIADWFQVPQSGFVSASVRDLCQIILLELHRKIAVVFSGDAMDIKYTGISVHRLYDCLAVLLQNAHTYGEDYKSISIRACASRAASDSSLDVVTVDVTSAAAEDRYMQSKQRIFQAIQAAEAGNDMVTEGYTGIKKIKFITRSSEGSHTIRCEARDDTRELTLSFTLHAESAKEEFEPGAVL